MILYHAIFCSKANNKLIAWGDAYNNKIYKLLYLKINSNNTLNSLSIDKMFILKSISSKYNEIRSKFIILSIGTRNRGNSILKYKKLFSKSHTIIISQIWRTAFKDLTYRNWLIKKN